MPSLGRIEGRAGSYHISSADGAVTLTSVNPSGYGAYAIIVQESTVISAMTNSAGEDLLSATQLNLSGKTLVAGAYIVTVDSVQIASITLSSGSVVAYFYNPKSTY